MPQQAYRFTAVMNKGDKADRTFWRFPADLYGNKHGETGREIDVLKEVRAPFPSHKLLLEIWVAWEQRHGGEAEALAKVGGPGISHNKITALLNCRKRELGHFTKGDLLYEMWTAWKDRHATEYKQIRKRMEAR